MKKLLCDICDNEMSFSPVLFLRKKIGEKRIGAKVRGKGMTAHVVRSGKTVEHEIFLCVTAEQGVFGGWTVKMDICAKCVKQIIIDEWMGSE